MSGTGKMEAVGAGELEDVDGGDEGPEATVLDDPDTKDGVVDMDEVAPSTGEGDGEKNGVNIGDCDISSGGESKPAAAKSANEVPDGGTTIVSEDTPETELVEELTKGDMRVG